MRRELTLNPRHCERSEAIQKCQMQKDWIATPPAEARNDVVHKSWKKTVVALCLFLAGCSTLGARDGVVETPDVKPNLLQESGHGRFTQENPVSAWWQAWNDPDLHDLVVLALKDNPDIAVALARVAEARAVVRDRQFDYLPTPEGVARFDQQRLSREGLNVVEDRSSRTYQAGFDATWEIDLFGRISEGVKAERARLASRQADLAAAYTSVAAEVARSYMELRGSQYRYAIAQKNANNQEKTFELTQNLFDGGRSNALDLERSRAQMENTKATLPLLSADIAASINRLGILTGQTPDALRTRLSVVKPLPSLPPRVAIGKTEDLLPRRPDVAAAQQDFLTATAEYNLALTDLYPQLTLEGAVGFLSTDFASLTTGGTSTYFFSPVIRWPIFNWGQVNARIDARDAVAGQKLAIFKKTVLAALEETDTAMVRFGREEERRARLHTAAVANARASELADERYRAGLDSFLDLLDAQQRQFESEDRLAQSDVQNALYLVAVYKALGGGWDLGEKAGDVQPVVKQ